MVGARELSPELAKHIADWERRAAASTDDPALHVFDWMTGHHAGPDGRMLHEPLDVVRSAFSDGHRIWAVAAAREMVAREPDRSDAALLLCAFLLRQGEPEAGPWVQRCLARWSEPSSGWVTIGEILLETNHKEAALLCLGKGMPSAPLAIRCGLLARDLGLRSEALDWFARAVRLDPANERGWFLLGASAQDARDLERAADAYRTVLKRNPERIEAAVNLGMVLQEAGRLEEAKESYRRAVHARAETFGRIAQALSGSPKGELWLDLAACRRSFGG